MHNHTPRHLQAPEPGAPTITEQAHLWYDGLAQAEPGTKEYQDYEHRVISLMGVELDGDPEYPVDLNHMMGTLALLGTEKRWWHNNPYHARRFKQAEQLGRKMVSQTFMHAAYESELIQHTTIDSMTGLLSRDGLNQKLLQRYGLNHRRPDGAIHSAESVEAHETQLTVANIDGARVKRVNDVLGHHMGDEFIVVIANELRDMLRGADGPLIVHYSGDEFGVVFGNISAEDLEGFERRMFDSQVAKLAGMRYVEAWEKIKRCKQEVLDAGQSLRIEAATEQLPPGADQHNLRPRRMVVINGQPVVAIEDIAIMAVGVASGPANCWNDYDDLNKHAETLMGDTKKVMHKMMPHDAELDTRPLANA
jgi:diguanylate cyclase (GGDEF)-like protein